MDLGDRPVPIFRTYFFSKFRMKTQAALALTVAAVTVSGCTPLLGGATTRFERLGPGEAPVVIGPPVRDNYTPMNPALACLANQIQEANRPKLTIAVDDIKDYTGQYNINEGNAITQGGSLMVMSALGKLDGTVNVADRFNTDVTQMELSFMNQRELGDGQTHIVGTGPDAKAVPWIPYYGGSIDASKYYITGGITELNYNVQSGGAQFQINQIGPKDRVYTEDVGIDLELVDTKTLLVVKSVSLVKELTGYEVGFNIFQFFGSNLYDLNIGNKSQEPAQLGVRTLLEDGVLRLVASAEDLNPRPCLEQAKGYWIPRESAEDFLKADQAADQAASLRTMAAPAPVMARTYLVFFDWDKAILTPDAREIVAQAASASHDQAVTTVGVSGYTDTSGTRAYNRALSLRRAKVVAAQMVADGVPADLIEIHAYGETHLLVPTGPNVRESKNRRVEIVVRADIHAPAVSSTRSSVVVPVHVASLAPTPPQTSDEVNIPLKSSTVNSAPTVVASNGSLNAATKPPPLQNGQMSRFNDEHDIAFDYGSSSVNGGDMSELNQIVAAVRQRPVQVVLLAPASENWAPSKRVQLESARIAAVRRALQIRGVMNFVAIWLPGTTQSTAVMDGAGFQKVAVMLASQ
jgi:outer membrane protein OmpA-like peptidoglycan-associated protein